MEPGAGPHPHGCGHLRGRRGGTGLRRGEHRRGRDGPRPDRTFSDRRGSLSHRGTVGHNVPQDLLGPGRRAGGFWRDEWHRRSAVGYQGQGAGSARLRAPWRALLGQAEGLRQRMVPRLRGTGRVRRSRPKGGRRRVHCHEVRSLCHQPRRRLGVSAARYGPGPRGPGLRTGRGRARGHRTQGGHPGRSARQPGHHVCHPDGKATGAAKALLLRGARGRAQRRVHEKGVRERRHPHRRWRAPVHALRIPALHRGADPRHPAA